MQQWMEPNRSCFVFQVSYKGSNENQTWKLMDMKPWEPQPLVKPKWNQLSQSCRFSQLQPCVTRKCPCNNVSFYAINEKGITQFSHLKYIQIWDTQHINNCKIDPWGSYVQKKITVFYVLKWYIGTWLGAIMYLRYIFHKLPRWYLRL